MGEKRIKCLKIEHNTEGTHCDPRLFLWFKGKDCIAFDIDEGKKQNNKKVILSALTLSMT